MRPGPPALLACLVACGASPSPDVTDAATDGSRDARPDAPADGARDGATDGSVDGSFDADATDAAADAGPPPRDDRFPWSEHEVPVPTIDCAAADARHIRSLDDLTALDDPAARIFCVHPGDYRAAGVLELTASGSETAPRMLVLYDPERAGESTHPVRLDVDRRATFAGFRIQGARYWILERLAFDLEFARTNTLVDGAGHNVVDRALIEHYGGSGFSVEDGCHDNTLQNSVVREGPRYVGDRIAVILHANGAGRVTTLRTRIVNNEIYNGTDAIQLHRFDTGGSHSDFAGTIIENNDLYADETAQVPCPTGGGTCGLFENGLDIKSGSDDPLSPVIVRNNRVWGWRRTDPASGSDSWGTAILVHNESQYVLVQSNTVFDSSRGIGVLPREGDGRITVIDNYVARITDDGNSGAYALVPYSGSGLEIYRNVIFGARNWLSSESASLDVRCNVVLEAPEVSAGGALSADYNFTYAAASLGGPHDIHRDAVSDARHEPRCFHVQMWTGPREVCLPNLQETDASPHHGACDPSLGSLPGYGVHDERW